jgi:hypothetical protein
VVGIADEKVDGTGFMELGGEEKAVVSDLVSSISACFLLV